MSSGKTANLKLNQWNLNDDFNMEDFNADNRILDSSMTALQNADAAHTTALNAAKTEQSAALEASIVWEKLMGVTTAASCAQINLDVSGIDWSKYTNVIIYWQLLHEPVNNDNLNATHAYMRVNNMSASGDYICSGKGYSSVNTTDTLFWMQNATKQSMGIIYTSFETVIPSAFGAMTAKTACRGMTCDYQLDYQCGTALSDGAVMPLSQVRALNFFVIQNSSGNLSARTLKAGCQIYMYGVRK